MTARGYSARKGTESFTREFLQPRPQVMSARALGVIVHLCSQPPGWSSSAEKLAATFKEGREAIEATLRELTALGLLDRRRYRGKDGRMAWLWIYGDDPAGVAELMTSKLRELGLHAA